jgi:maltose/maltodextrin transport system substrate-binding protein
MKKPFNLNLFSLITAFVVFSLFQNIVFAETKSLVIWTSSEGVRNAILSQADQFQKDYNAKITVNVLNKDLTTQFKTAAMAGKGPDLFAWAHDVVGELAQSGLIAPITMPKELKDKIFPVAIEAFTYKGALYGYPYDLESVALIYNKKFFPTAPKTFEEILQSSSKFGKKKFAFLYDLNNFFFSFPLLTAAGGYIFKNENGTLNSQNIGLNNDGATLGAKFIKRLVDDKIIPSSTDRNIAFNQMLQGNLGATIDGPWALNDLRKNKVDYGIAPLPTLKGHTPKPFVGTHGFILRRGTPNIDLAKEFVENYLMTKKGMLGLFKEDPRGPVRIDLLKELALNSPDIEQFMNSAKSGIPMPNIPAMGAVWGAMGGALKLITTGQLTAKQALDDAKKQILNALQGSQNKVKP